MSEQLKWAWLALCAIFVFLLFVAVFYGLTHPYVFRFEMDENTLEAVRAINWTAIAEGGRG